jgi:hypothetical protein
MKKIVLSMNYLLTTLFNVPKVLNLSTLENKTPKKETGHELVTYLFNKSTFYFAKDKKTT